MTYTYVKADDIHHDNVMKWKHFPRHWPFVRGIHRSPVNSPHKGQRRGALMFSSICVWINGWVNNREAGDLSCHRAHYDVIVMDARFVVIDDTKLVSGRLLEFSNWHFWSYVEIYSLPSLILTCLILSYLKYIISVSIRGMLVSATMGSFRQRDTLKVALKRGSSKHGNTWRAWTGSIWLATMYLGYNGLKYCNKYVLIKFCSNN